MNKKNNPRYLLIKRCIDIFIALFSLLIMMPLFLLIALLILLTIGRPIFFVQLRPGKNEKLFKLYKYRTMTNKKDHNGELLPDNLRLTALGSLLRKLSLDELPELINVLKGDMSLVGPRPLLMKYLPYYLERERLRHTVRPGITGLAQVHGRNFLGWKDRLEKDVEYVEKLNFFLDVKIILRTVSNVLKRKGIALNIIDDLDDYRKKNDLTSINENTTR